MKKVIVFFLMLILILGTGFSADSRTVFAGVESYAEQNNLFFELGQQDSVYQSDEDFADFQPYHIPAFTGEIERSNEPVSIGAAPIDIYVSDGEFELTVDPEVYGINSAPSAYGFDHRSDSFYRWLKVTNTDVSTTLGEPSTLNRPYAGDFRGNDFSQLYVIDSADKGLYSIDTLSGTHTFIGSTGLSDPALTGIAYGDGIMYGVSLEELDGTYCVEGTRSKLLKINLDTGSITNIGVLSKAPCIIDIAYVPSNGMLYGVDIVNDSLIKINPETAEDTIIGSLGMDVQWAQGMDYDEVNKVLYWASFQTDGTRSELRIIDINTGGSAPIGYYPEGYEIDSFAIPPEDYTFLPNPDGYSFKNYGGVNHNDFTVQDLIQMFGNDAVCLTGADRSCVPKRQAEKWRNKIVNVMNGGHCEGMAVTSLRSYAGIDTHPGHTFPYNLVEESVIHRAWGNRTEPTTVRRNIAFFFALQATSPVKLTNFANPFNPPSVVLNKIVSALRESPEDYLNISITYNFVGHALTPYAVVDKGNGVYWIKVYDNNKPGDVNSHVVVNTKKQSWEYDLGGGTVWSGSFPFNWATSSISVRPVSLYSQQPRCPWCFLFQKESPDEHEILFDGKGELLVQDSHGRRLGYQAGEYYEKIPDAYIQPLDGGLGLPPTLIYTLPATDTYTMSLTGDGTKEAGEASINAFGPGYAVSLEDIQVNGSTNDTIVFGSDGTEMSYLPSQTQSATMSTAVDTANGSWQLEVIGVQLAPGEQQALTVDTSAEDFTINRNNSGEGDYEIYLMRSSEEGLDMYSHKNVYKKPGETHKVRFDVFKDQNIVILDIDRNGDGVYDDSIPLENQVTKIFFPSIFN